MNTTERRHDIDWLRVMAFYILIFFHVGMVFVPWDFHIKNLQTAEWFEIWMNWLHQWRLPLLFMISGIVIYYSLGKRRSKGFLLERSRRLLIPLIFGMLVIIPPQIYVERISNGVHFANYWEFWKIVFNFIPYPDGGALSWHHLWYVLYIFVYSIAALPIFLFFRSDKSKSLKTSVGNFIGKHPNSIYFLVVPLALSFVLLVEKFPTTNSLVDDWYNHAVSFSLFLFGFFISSIEGVWTVLVNKRKLSLMLGAILPLILTLFVWGSTFEFLWEQYSWFIYAYAVIKWLAIVAWLFAALGYGKIYLNKPGKVLTYANESVYPLYILHQSVELVFAYYIIQLDWGVFPKFALLVIATFGVSLLIYELFIKRYSLTRLLFGMKPKPKQIRFSNNRFNEISNTRLSTVLSTTEINTNNQHHLLKEE